MDETLPEIENLIRETIALVDAHIPHLDTTAAKARLGWWQQPWQM